METYPKTKQMRAAVLAESSNEEEEEGEGDLEGDLAEVAMAEKVKKVVMPLEVVMWNAISQEAPTTKLSKLPDRMYVI